jgi:hypothetical protein
MSHRIKTIAVAATASALTVAGMAVASGGDGKDDRHSAPAFAGNPVGKSLTYSETHLREDGEDVTVRVDQGRVLAATASSISIRRNDGATADVPVDGDTKVWGGWWHHKSHGAKAAHRKRDGVGVAQIPEGKRVLVLRSDDDEAAEAVTVAKRHWHSHRRGDDDHDRSHHDRDDD